MKLIEYNGKPMWEFVFPIGGAILLLQADKGDINQVEKAIKNIREGKPVNEKNT